MSFTINTNVSSLQAQQYLNLNAAFQGKTIQRVTSGLRIVSSGDDAAGLAIANGYRSDQAVLNQGVRNANDGLSQLQIIDGGINNISQLLDRARTLATQSASGTFTGDRSVLDSEFQSVVTEINRQAQSIGLDQNGAFAQNLQVFIGGGKANNGISQISNGSVSLDLSKSTVDSRSLGLTGVQAIGVAGTDIGAGSANTSLSAILGNNTNTSSVATAGYTSFTLKGPGFDGNGVKISVNTSNLGGTSDLVSAVNAAIQAAASQGTQQGTALKNANISASINTDANGKQQLVFSSSTSAFQVEAGDRLSNALLGNFEQNASLTGTDNSAYVDTSAGGAAKQLTIAVNGGSSFTVNVTQGGATSKGQIVADLNANNSFNAVAVASLNGNQIVLKSKSNASTSSIAITSTTLATNLGLSTTTQTAAAASTGAAITTQVQGANAVQAGANFVATDSGATAVIDATHKNITLTVGSSGAQTLTLANLGTQTKAEIASDINALIVANGNFTGANGVTASVVNNQIVFTATSPSSSITFGTPGSNSANGILGITTGTYSTHTVTASDTVRLRFQGSGLTTPVDISLTGFTAGTTTTAQILTDLNSKISTNSALQAAGITLTTSAAGNNLVFSSSKGEQFQVLATGDSQNVLGLGSFVTGPAISPTDYTSITAGNNYSQSTIGTGTATLQVSLSGQAANSNAISVNLTGAGTDATAGTTTGTVAVPNSGQIDLTANSATGALSFVIDGTHAYSVTVTHTATTALTKVASDITAALSGNGTAYVDSNGHLAIKSATTGSSSSVEITSASDAGTLTDLGLSAGVNRGANASAANVVNQINNAIAGNTALANSGLQASLSGSAIQLVSNNNTYFRVNAFGSDLGFGAAGQSFTGNLQSAAPATSQYFDAQGSTATNTIAYSDTLYGSDTQTVSVTGLDASGAKHSLAVKLQNNTTARNQTIDQALNTINTALQQSNDSTLQSIVAVKDSSGGTQSIRFLSTLKSFQVAIDSDAGGTGLTPPTGNVANGTTLGTGLTASVLTQSNAAAAVTALANAVSALGKSQAVVGRGQNEFNYAVNLAQSQVTNLAAAESRIRDADLASEAANLTKSQILVQAGVAALAQANSAPQQILSLLRG